MSIDDHITRRYEFARGEGEERKMKKERKNRAFLSFVRIFVR